MVYIDYTMVRNYKLYIFMQKVALLFIHNKGKLIIVRENIPWESRSRCYSKRYL